MVAATTPADVIPASSDFVITDHISGPDNALDRVCASVCPDNSFRIK